jgi:flagellar FliL protein
MAEAEEGAQAPAAPSAAPKKGKKKLLLLIVAPLVLLLGGGGGAVMFVPALHKMVLGGGAGAAAAKADDPQATEAAKPFFVEVPEITVTLPNSGRPRQMRIKLSLELMKHLKEGEHADTLLTPRISDGLVLYLRTLRDADVDGALSVDRMRGDIQRRLDLLMGEGVVRDVLITSLVLG